MNPKFNQFFCCNTVFAVILLWTTSMLRPPPVFVKTTRRAWRSFNLDEFQADPRRLRCVTTKHGMAWMVTVWYGSTTTPSLSY